MNARARTGLTIIEVLVAIAILGIILAFIVPSFAGYLNVNTRTEIRSQAAAAAQQVLEDQRRADPNFLPMSGPSERRAVEVGGRTFQVVVHYCTQPAYCSTGSRQMKAEVSFNRAQVFQVETVYTKLNSETY